MISLEKCSIDYTSAFKELPENEKKVLENILTKEEKDVCVEVLCWVNEINQFTSIDKMLQRLQLNDKKEDIKKSVEIFYNLVDIPWLVHKYWIQPKTYLLERLENMRSSRTFMLNIYSALLVTAGLGVWLLCLKSIFDYAPDIILIISRPITSIFFIQHLLQLILFLASLLVFFGGLLLLFCTGKRRQLVLRIKRPLIDWSINSIEIESYIISTILDKKKKEL